MDKKPKNRSLQSKIIIHFHGGGFVVMDSFSHQNYTRRWANDLSVPIFSVDYRLAPKNPYPDPVNDCYQAYVWIVTHAESQLGFKPDHIILTGDSAGGHLSISTAILAMLRGFRIPDRILPHYPVFCIDMGRFFPSIMISMDEEVLSQSFMTFCRAAFTR